MDSTYFTRWGYDAYGLPAEQYAIQTGQHPAVTTKHSPLSEQLDKIGFCYDWDREVRTCEPDYANGHNGLLSKCLTPTTAIRHNKLGQSLKRLKYLLRRERLVWISHVLRK